MTAASGTVLENLSSKKLYVLVLSLSAIVILSFAIGLACPKPATVLLTLFTPCKVRHKDWANGQFFYNQRNLQLTQHCKEIKTQDMKQDPEEGELKTINDWEPGSDVVFVAEIPRSNRFVLSPFHQYIITLIDFQIQYLNRNKIKTNVIYLDVRLGGRNDEDSEWTEIASGEIDRSLSCEYPSGAKENEDLPDGYNYDCAAQPLFQLGSTSFQHYLVNIHVNKKSAGKTVSSAIGNLYGIMMPVIVQNAKYTKVLFSMKTLFTPLLMFAIFWFWRRVINLQRKLELIEQSVVFLGIMLLQLDFPVDWLSIFISSPVILFISDIRQGLFYVGLLSFWVIFSGEHLLRKSDRNRLRGYTRELSVIIICCLALFLFDLMERGAQIVNPFNTVWSASHSGYNIAIALIVIGAISGTLYFCFLFYLVYNVFRSIKEKTEEYTQMNRRRHIFEGIVFRFKFFMVSTMVMAAVTIIFFILIQVQESTVYFGESHNFNVDSVVSTGVFGMWNVYTIAVLFLYAPSHRDKEDGVTFVPARSEMFQLDNEEEEDESDMVNKQDSDLGYLDKTAVTSSSQSQSSVKHLQRGKGFNAKNNSGGGARQKQHHHPQSTSSSSLSNVIDDIGSSESLVTSETGKVGSSVVMNTNQEPSVIYTMLGKQNML